jgi:hypothetical protein
MNKNQSWLNETVTRSTSVVPVHGFGMGDVRPMAAGYSASTSTLKRHADAIKATPVAVRQPWSPPVT